MGGSISFGAVGPWAEELARMMIPGVSPVTVLTVYAINRTGL